MGLLLGVIGGLAEFAVLPAASSGLPLDLAATLRPSPVPLALHLEGNFAAAVPTPAAQAVQAAQAVPATPTVPPTPAAPATPAARAQAGPTEPPVPHKPGPWLLADGDSWFDYWGVPGAEPADPNTRPCVLSLLRDQHGYQVEELADAGDLLSDMASAAQLAQFSVSLRRMLATGRPPIALLLSGGGNDVVAERLYPIILPKAKVLPHANADPMLAEPPSLLNLDRLARVIDVDLAQALGAILRHWLAVRDTLMKAGQRPPILLHGYDYPIPDGRNAFGVVDLKATSWLGAMFAQRGYDDVTDRASIDASTQMLIDKLNAMQLRVANAINATSQVCNVVHLDLRGALRNGAGGDYRFAGYPAQWENELHPTPAGFAKIAAVFAGRLKTLALC